MFRELYNLSQHVEEALPPVGYGLVEAHIAISVDPPITSIPKVTESSKGKESLGEKLCLPDFVRSSNHRPLAIADTADYILGIGKHGLIRHPMYLDLLQECLDETQDEAVEAVWRVVQELDVEAIRKSCSPWFDKGEPLDKARIIFIYKGDIVTDRPSVQKFWGRKFTELLTSWETSNSRKKKAKKNSSADAEAQMFREGICTITGNLKQLVGPTLPLMIKGVPSTQGKGAALMSFNCESFESRQWKDSEHAPLGFDVAERSHQILNRLLREKRHSYQQGKTKFVYWGEYDTGLNPDIWDDPDSLWDDDAAAVAQMIFTTPEQPKGFSADACKSERFYLAILTGCDGRIAISRWDELTPQKIADNVTRYIQTQKGISGYRARAIWQLAGACFRDPAKEQVDNVVRALVNNALWGAKIPKSIVRQTIERIYLDLFSDKRDLKKYHQRYYARFQILALYLGLMTEKRPLEVARRIGAIAYLMHHAEMQARDLKDPGKTGIAASLRALATTPKQTFGRLYHNAILYHLPAKCEDGDPKERKGRRDHLRRTQDLLKKEFKKLAEIQLSPETDLPTTWTLDESAWFYLGWGLREATFWKSDKKNSGIAQPDNPNSDESEE